MNKSLTNVDLRGNPGYVGLNKQQISLALLKNIERMKMANTSHIEPQWINPAVLIVDIKGSDMTTLQDRMTPRDTGSFTTTNISTNTKKTLSIKRPGTSVKKKAIPRPPSAHSKIQTEYSLTNSVAKKGKA